MKTPNTLLIVFALFVATPAAAQVVHAVDDPNPETKGCGSHLAAFHANKDAVMVGYHGSQHLSRNGGFEGTSCYLEHITRTRPEGSVVWSISPGAGLGDAGFSSHKVHGMAAMPDGRTVVVTSENTLEDDSQHVYVMMYGEAGTLQWTNRSAVAPSFALGRPYVSDDGHLFVGYSFSNFAKPGSFKVSGGKTWSVRRLAQRNIVTRISTRDGSLEWETEGHLESVAGGQVVATMYRRKKGMPVRARHVVYRFDYNGNRLGTFTTPEFTSEHVRNTTSWNGHVVMVTDKEEVEDGRVRERRSRLHVFDNSGKRKLVKVLSDGARLAESAVGAPLRVVAPTNCERGVVTYGCVTDALEVVTFEDLTTPTYSRIEFDGVRFANTDRSSRSVPGGIWLSAKAWDEDAAPGSVSMRFDDEQLARRRSAPANFVWSPMPSRSGGDKGGFGPILF